MIGGGMERYTEYKVIRVSESGLATILFGASVLPMKKLEKELNHYAKDGWQVVFQTIEHQRYLLFWTRESMIVTLGR